MKYKLGNMVRMSCATTKLNPTTGAYDPSTPTMVTCLVLRKLSPPAVSVAVVADPGVGKYHADYLPPVAGDYVYQFTGTGDCVCQSDGAFTVLPSPI